MYSWCAYFIFSEALLVGKKIYMPATSSDDIILVDFVKLHALANATKSPN
jgi:hypothetical protein